MQKMTLEELIEFNPKVKFEKQEYYDFIPMENINPNEKFVSSVEKSLWDSNSGSKFENGDVLFARIYPCLDNKKIAVARVDGQGFGSTEFFVLRAREGISDPNFIFYLAKTDLVVQNAINSYVGASGRQRADLNFIKRCVVDVPSFENQQKIAGILSAYDELIENNKKRIALLETMAEELYKEWFVRFRFPNYENTEFEIGMPKNWHTELIKNLVDRKRFGKLFKEDEVSEKGNIPVYDQSRDNFFGFYNGEPEHKASFENPIIIFGDHTCKMKILFSDFSLAENVIPLKAKDNVNLNYLFYLIKDSVKTTEYKRHWTELTNKKVLIAPIELQNKFSEIIQGNLKMIDNLVHQNFKLAESRDSLLPRLISGKLSVENLDVQQPPTPAQPNDSE